MISMFDVVTYNFFLGYSCPEFNQGGNTIQANYKHKCNESDPPCPFKYNSSKVFNCKLYM